MSPLSDPVPEKNGNQLFVDPLVGVTMVAVPVDGVITNIDASATNDREHSNNASTIIILRTTCFFQFCTRGIC